MVDVDIVYFPSKFVLDFFKLACTKRHELQPDDVLIPPDEISFCRPPRTKLFTMRILPVDKCESSSSAASGGGGAPTIASTLYYSVEDVGHDDKSTAAAETSTLPSINSFFEKRKRTAKPPGSSNLTTATISKLRKLDIANSKQLRTWDIKHATVKAEMATKTYDRLVPQMKLMNKGNIRMNGILTNPEAACLPSAYYHERSDNWIQMVSLRLKNYLYTSGPTVNDERQKNMTPVEIVLRKCYEVCTTILTTEFNMKPVDPHNVGIGTVNGGKPIAVLSPDYANDVTEYTIKRLFAMAAFGTASVYTDGNYVVWFGAAFMLPFDVAYRNITTWMRTGCPIYADNYYICENFFQAMFTPQQLDVLRDLRNSILSDERQSKIPFLYSMNPTPSIFVQDSLHPFCVRKESNIWDVSHWLAGALLRDEPCTCSNCFQAMEEEDEEEDGENEDNEGRREAKMSEEESVELERERNVVHDDSTLEGLVSVPLKCMQRDIISNQGGDMSSIAVWKMGAIEMSHIRVEKVEWPLY